MSEIKTKVTAETAEATSKINRFVGTLKGIGVAAKGIGAGVTLALGPIAAIGAALGVVTAGISGFKNAIDYGGELDDLSTSTGIAVDKLVVLQNAFELAGLSGDLVGKAVLGLNNKLEAPTPKIIDTLSKLGLSFQSIENLSMEERFSVVSKAIGGLADSNDRAAASSTLFGGALGRGLLPLFAGGASAIDDAARNVGGLGQTMAKNAPAFAKIGDALDSVIVKSRQFFAAFIGANADRLVEIADAFMGIDLTKAGEQMGQMLNSVVEISKIIMDSFGQGTLGVTFQNALELGWLNFKPILLSSMELAAEVFTTALIEGMSAPFGIFKTVNGFLPESMRQAPETFKALATANKVLAEMNRGTRASRTGLSPEEQARKAELEAGFKPLLGLALSPKEKANENRRKIKEETKNFLDTFDTSLKEIREKISKSLGQDTKFRKEQEAEKEKEEKAIKEKKAGSFMDFVFGDTQRSSTSLQSIGGASALTGTFNEVQETNNILRRIEQILGKPINYVNMGTTSTSFAP